ncbi:AMP-binding protein [Pseudonocardia sp. RS11V-5]|uniref:AMP-binding protein n=1 Tax=Pseudonocardia terrae TaxID=2905831 RepID=UPI001E469954|nr:AMP-binding protein [Pseudonocardia terrae]MCE3554659.1 AMP-binding protein [Pseudonocardia terrae]
MLPSDTVLPVLLGTRAAERPDAPFVVVAESGDTWTYAQAHADTTRWAAALARAGVAAGDTVLTMLPPCTEAVAAWLGTGRLRAMEVPVNTGYIGTMLRYLVDDSRAAIMIAHVDHLAAIADAAAGPGRLGTVVVVGARGPLPESPFELVHAADFLAAAADDPAPEGPLPTGRDIASILYTSGTTGPSKGVLVTWRQAELTATGIMPSELFDATDAFYSGFPLFHMSGKGPLYACALVGARVVMRRRFDTKAFWDDVRTYGATTTILLGAMANFLYQQPARPDDADSPLRDALFLPLIHDLDGFRSRFGVQARTTFNMTETACCILSDGADLANATSCGRARPGFHARVVDADDVEVGPGELGELVLRADEPWTLMAGYWRKPEATVEAWRNQWLHTGDGFTRDAEGNFYFVDRIKDAIRRRGENISSAEVEAEVNGHPAVLESAAVAVPSEYGEDEVKIVVVPQPGHDLDPAELVGYLSARMARFMVPRYVEIVDALPKTPTEKIRKVELRAAGITPATWDRSAAR